MGVDGPVDAGFTLGGEVVSPNITIARIVCDVEAVDDGDATGEFGMRFDVEEMIGVGRDQSGIDSDGHGDGIGKREAVFASLFVEGGDSGGVAFDGKRGDGILVGEDLLNFYGTEDGAAAAEMPADQFDRELATDDGAGRFGIAPDIVFGGGSDVTFAAGIAAHENEARNVASEVRAQFERQRDVGERADSNDHDAGIGFNGLQDSVDGVKLFGDAVLRSITAIGEAVFAVEPVGRSVRACQRLGGANVDRRFGVAEFGDVEGVARSLVDGDIAGDGGDGAEVDVRVAKGHENGDSVVGGGVGVDEERNFVGHGKERIARKRKQEARR